MIDQRPAFIALGNFDGIHRGHRRVIDSILQCSTDGLETAVRAVVSFSPHPQEFFTGVQRPLLTPTHEKRAYLEAIGLDELILLPFDAKMACLTPREFVETVLIQQLNVQRVSVGQNFRFGQRRSGTTMDLKTIAAEYGIPVDIADLCLCGSDRISSSAIRHALVGGDVATANRLLGRPYSLTGTVIQGQQLGRTIGFPTANLSLPPEKFIPRHGVYAVHAVLAQDTASQKTLAAVMNIGTRPTVDGLNQTTEVHLLDWSGNLYGQTLTVHLRAFLRAEQKFDSLEQLKAQITQDCGQARSLAL